MRQGLLGGGNESQPSPRVINWELLKHGERKAQQQVHGKPSLKVIILLQKLATASTEGGILFHLPIADGVLLEQW